MALHDIPFHLLKQYLFILTPPKSTRTSIHKFFDKKKGVNVLAPATQYAREERVCVNTRCKIVHCDDDDAK